MKAIYYDAEGDILSVTFSDAGMQTHRGIELADNIVLYFDPDREQPIKLIFISYLDLLQASEQMPIVLDGLARAPAKIRALVVGLLQRAPLNAFFRVVDVQGKVQVIGRLTEVFSRTTLESVTVS